MVKNVITAIVVFGLFFSCANKTEEHLAATLFQFVPAKNSGVDFVNSVKDEKDFNIFTYRNFYNGGGVGIGDINNDGFSDIYMIANMGENKLYLNQGDFTFKDITEKAGVSGKRAWSTGVAMVDVNQDGLLDIYVCNAGNVEGDDHKNELFINNGDLTFTDKATDYNLDDAGYTTHAAFFDYDSDGDLDVYILNNSFIPVNSLGYSNRRMLRSDEWSLPDEYRGGGDKLMQNDNGKFVDVSEEAGIMGSLIAFGMGVTVGDINQDMLPDIYISNDFYECDYMYINQGDGTFKESLRDYIQHLSMSSMGADLADINNDGYAEIFVTDMLPEGDERLKNTSEFETYDLVDMKYDLGFYNQYMQNALHLNNGNETFSEIAYYSGSAQTDWSWGALLLDMDNDGYRDIYVSNGIYYDLTDMDFMDYFADKIMQKMKQSGEKEEVENIISQMPSNPIPNYALRNNGNLTFENMAASWGLDVPSFSNGSAYGDLDNDGDLDLVISNVNQICHLFRNTTSDKGLNNYIAVDLKGGDKNIFGIGAAVYVYYNGLTLKQEEFPTRGFQSSVGYRLNFGLANHQQADSVVVYWPNGYKQRIDNVAANSWLTLDVNNATTSYNSLPKIETEEEIFEQKQTAFEKHNENVYIDFEQEGLVPHKTSREGPAIAVGDINGDNRDDVFIGGATDEIAQLWIQNQAGDFIKRNSNDLATDKLFEDTAALLFDADDDGDTDLYVGSGGNDAPSADEKLMDRLYLNDGRGNFTHAASALPNMRYNTSVIAANDFDADGDADLFIGNMGVSQIYGINPKQYLLENDGHGNFTDVTESKAYKLMDAGMVTDALWYDINNDERKELIVVGEWMAPKIYASNGRRLQELSSSLDSLTGWWNAVSAADLNLDGTADLVLGNRGLNMYYHASHENPAKMFIHDFDNNGTVEQILTRHLDGMDKPIPLKRELTNQIVSLKKTNLTFSDFAIKSIYEILPSELLDNSLVKDTRIFESVVAYNNGDLQFSIDTLPAEIQFSSVNRILTTDVNGDNYPDLLLGGNDFDYKPQFGRLDAGFFHLLEGGEQGFSRISRSGIKGTGMVRSLNQITINKTKHLLIGINDEKAQLYKIK
ncbi:VCBS repeat-containing protein [Draconibacterium halophilum]|uniref:VCBS repeat-containing protein n=1 Tax=Draconibacterium halophilum TaxID=2706887 RepID=A0A6C0RCD5_9BACT|nr:VCBS repeat-containing protein [Draconibacterium halophilum]QIA07696.1 VCBS repeat-containing protein [Draconibacterium halophilum]